MKHQTKEARMTSKELLSDTFKFCIRYNYRTIYQFIRGMLNRATQFFKPNATFERSELLNSIISGSYPVHDSSRINHNTYLATTFKYIQLLQDNVYARKMSSMPLFTNHLTLNPKP